MGIKSSLIFYFSNYWRDLDSIKYDTYRSGVVVKRNKSPSCVSSALLVNYDGVLVSMNVVCSLRPECCLEELGYSGLRWGGILINRMLKLVRALD